MLLVHGLSSPFIEHLSTSSFLLALTKRGIIRIMAIFALAVCGQHIMLTSPNKPGAVWEKSALIIVNQERAWIHRSISPRRPRIPLSLSNLSRCTRATAHMVHCLERLSPQTKASRRAFQLPAPLHPGRRTPLQRTPETRSDKGSACLSQTFFDHGSEYGSEGLENHLRRELSGGADH